MPEARLNIAAILLQTAFAEWITTLSLIFGGCCSNAWALELTTSQYPHAGSLITFAQFLLVSAYGLRRQITIAPISITRKQLLRMASANILHLRSGKPAGEHFYVAVEGPASASHTFTDELVHDIEFSSPTLTVKHLKLANDVKDISQLDSPHSLTPGLSVALVTGEHLRAPEFRGRWDYCIWLVIHRGSAPNALLTDSSLVVDLSCIHPVVISSVSTFPKPWRLLNTLTRIRLKKRSIPISHWAIQVALFLITSLLNNAAFGYNVPMAVHIIFRSGGLVVNMLIGWFIGGRRYNPTQIFSVVIVTLGVVCTTLSASQPSPGRMARLSSSFSGSYIIGILILTLALIVSGFMGLAQDKSYEKYGRGHWQEAMFYLHFLALPGFMFVWRDLVNQIRTVNASARVEMGYNSLVMGVNTLVKTAGFSITWQEFPYPAVSQNLMTGRISIPSVYFPLMLNVVTQLICVSGVNRLTSRVNSLTVTLVLVVRKAVSLGISVVLLKDGRGGGGGLLWTGAALVLGGTIGYTVGGSPKGRNGKKEG